METSSFAREFETLKRLGSATVHEALGQRGQIDGKIAPLDPGTKMVGRAYTVETRPSDNLMLHYALAKAQPGDVIVVDAKGFTGAAHWGDLMTYSAVRRGIAGLVIDGAVRDASAIVEMGFPVFCRGLSLAGPTKNQPGRVQESIVVGGCAVASGDIVMGDRDGVVVVPAASIADVVRNGVEREAKESGVRKRIDEGATTVEVFGLRDLLHKWGLD